MTLYTAVPLELVLEGWSGDREPLIEIQQGGLLMLLTPVAPGLGKLERLVAAPLEAYLLPSLAPGSLIRYGPAQQTAIVDSVPNPAGEWGQ